MKKRYPFLPKNWLRAGLTTAFAATFSLSLQAQTALVKQWDKTFGGSGIDHLYSGQRTSDGGFIFGGPSNSGAGGDKTEPFQGGHTDFWVVKTDSLGNKQWDKSFGSSDGDALMSIFQNADGSYLLGGTTSGSGISGDKSQAGYGYSDMWVIKIDAAGNKLWDKVYGGSEFDGLTSIKQTSDGGYLLAGGSNSGISGTKTQPSRGLVGTSSDYWVVKIDAFGNKLWDKVYGGNYAESFFDMQLTSDGGFILGGWSESGINGDKTQAANGNMDYWVVKADAAGNKQWDKAFGGSGEDRFRAVQQTIDGGYILGGWSKSGISADKSQPSKGMQDYWVIKLDATGSKVWDKTFGTNDLDELYKLDQTPDGGFLLIGYSNSGINGDKTQASNGWADYWVIKINATGIKLWDQSYGGSGTDWGCLTISTPDGGFVIAGESTSGISGDKSQPNNGNSNTSDFWFLKVGFTTTGIHDGQAFLPLSIFPNPTQGKFKIQFSNLTSPKTEVTISDLLGRKVLQQEFQVLNNQLSEEITLPNAKGIYLLQLKTGNHTITRKIVVE